MKFQSALWCGWLTVAAVMAGCGQWRMVPAGGAYAPQVAGKRATPAPMRITVRPLSGNYYDPAAGLTGRDLLMALNRVVAKHTDLGYDQARDVMFAAVDDLDNDNIVRCIYIGRALEGITNRMDAYRNGEGFNAEHTWPQSKGAEGAARDDLHHLFPADVRTNGLRGSLPFGDVTETEWSQGGSVLGLNAQGVRVFQPRPEQRGNTARALLYFFTVYGASASLDVSNFQVEETVIKRWHTEDPVDAQERARNDMVYNVQGNRNPYVDHPEFVAQVGTFMAESYDRNRPRRR